MPHRCETAVVAVFLMSQTAAAAIALPPEIPKVGTSFFFSDRPSPPPSPDLLRLPSVHGSSSSLIQGSFSLEFGEGWDENGEPKVEV